MLHGDSNLRMAPGASGTAAEASPKKAQTSFEWAAIGAFLFGAILGFGGSLVSPRQIAKAFIGNAEPTVHSRADAPKAPSAQPQIALPPRAPAPAPVAAPSPPSEEEGLVIPGRKPTGTIPAAGKNRLRVQRRQAPAAPRAHSETIDLEHDFSFLPTGNAPPKEKLKPLPF